MEIRNCFLHTVLLAEMLIVNHMLSVGYVEKG